jgi:hypothetical protein
MDLVNQMQKTSPYVLCSLDRRAVFMNKKNPLYAKVQTPKDMIVSQDCVLANESRLFEITEELGLSPEYGVFELQD